MSRRERRGGEIRKRCEIKRKRGTEKWEERKMWRETERQKCGENLRREKRRELRGKKLNAGKKKKREIQKINEEKEE